MSAELRAALYGECSTLHQADLDRFRAAGVDSKSLISPYSIMRAPVVFLANNRIEFASHSRHGDDFTSAFVTLAHNCLGDEADLVAWRGDQIGSWLGSVTMLGEENCLAFRIEDVLDVHETPLDWLKADRAGCVIVDRRMAPGLLRHAGSPLRVQSLDHARRLRETCTEKPPRILVPLSERRIAA